MTRGGAEPMAEHPVDCEGGWIPCWVCDGEGDSHDCGEAEEAEWRAPASEPQARRPDEPDRRRR